MSRSSASSAFALLTAALAALLILQPAAAGAWTLTLKDVLSVADGGVTLAELSATEVPAEAGGLVVVSGGRPGGVATVSRTSLLRRLVREGLARDVRFAGAERCRVEFRGDRIDSEDLAGRLRAALAEWLPRAPEGAPDTWCGLEGSLPSPAVGGDWRLEITEPRRLEPGRNLVRVGVVDGGRTTRFTATVVCHLYGETARARTNIRRGEPLDPAAFAWEWRDLAVVESNLVVGRESLSGMSAAAAIGSGDPLRVAAVVRTPLVMQGDPVEVMLTRGGVTVCVTGHARQDGHRDQIITVRNDLNGDLMTGRVMGPGRVAWKR